jgi:hypothetical protein
MKKIKEAPAVLGRALKILKRTIRKSMSLALICQVLFYGRKFRIDTRDGIPSVGCVGHYILAGVLEVYLIGGICSPASISLVPHLCEKTLLHSLELCY